MHVQYIYIAHWIYIILIIHVHVYQVFSVILSLAYRYMYMQDTVVVMLVSQCVSVLVCQQSQPLQQFFLLAINWRSQRIQSLAPIYMYVHLCFLVCETLAFWRTNNKLFWYLFFMTTILIIASHTYCLHNTWLKIVLADFVLLFRCVCLFVLQFLSLNQAVSRQGIHSPVHLLILYCSLQQQYTCIYIHNVIFQFRYIIMRMVMSNLFHSKNSRSLSVQ